MIKPQAMIGRQLVEKITVSVPKKKVRTEYEKEPIPLETPKFKGIPF
jgi:hypothetical protein